MSAQHLPHPAAGIGSSMVARLARSSDRGVPTTRPADPWRHSWHILFAWTWAHLHLPRHA